MSIAQSIISNIKKNRDYTAGNLRYQSIDINITGGCTYDCIFCECQQLNIKEDLTKEELFDLADQMADLDIFNVFIGGGEPLMRNDLADILKYYKSKGISIHLISNASLPKKLTDEMIEVIDSCVSELTISIDSGVKDEFNLTRANKNAMDLAIKTLERTSLLKNTSTSISSVITNKSFRGIPLLVDMASKYNVGSISAQPVSDAINYPGTKLKSGKSDLFLKGEEIEELRDILKKAEEMAKEKSVKTSFSTNEWIYQYFINREKGDIFYRNMVEEFRCFVAFRQMSIRHNGDVQLCAITPGFDNIRKTRLKDILYGDNKVKDNLRNGKLTKICEKCFCGMNANLNFSTTYMPLKNRKQIAKLVMQKISK